MPRPWLPTNLAIVPAGRGVLPWSVFGGSAPAMFPILVFQHQHLNSLIMRAPGNIFMVSTSQNRDGRISKLNLLFEEHPLDEKQGLGVGSW
jgi:hypothetical protein